MSNLERSYHGYLSPYVECIRAMHLTGADTRAIAEELYRLGVRAQAIDYFPKMRRKHQIANLRSMARHVLCRIGLHAPRKRPPRWS